MSLWGEKRLNVSLSVHHIKSKFIHYISFSLWPKKTLWNHCVYRPHRISCRWAKGNNFSLFCFRLKKKKKKRTICLFENEKVIYIFLIRTKKKNDIYIHIVTCAYVCTDKSIIFLCGLKYIGQVIIHGPHRQCRIVLPGVAKFGSMDREDTIEIRVFFQCQNPDGVFCVFIRGGRGHATCLFNIRHFTPVIEMAAAGAP